MVVHVQIFLHRKLADPVGADGVGCGVLPDRYPLRDPVDGPTRGDEDNLGLAGVAAGIEQPQRGQCVVSKIGDWVPVRTVRRGPT